MAPSTDRRSKAVSSAKRGWLAIVATAALPLGGCSDLPSKSDALAVVQHEVQEDTSCVLPIPILARFKMQYSTKTVCIPREQGVAPPGAKDPALVCLDAIAASGATRRMPESYMAEWPDEVSSAGFDTISPYERRARDLLFKACFQMADLREGRFHCAQATVDKILRISKSVPRAGTDDKQVLVRYTRALVLDASLPAIEAACGPVTRPPVEATATLEKTDKQWTLVRDGAAPAASSGPSTPAR